MIAALVLATLAIFVALAASGFAAAPAGPSPRKHWEPKPTTAAWQWQLQGRIKTGVQAASTRSTASKPRASTVRRLHRHGRKVICYLDVGSWESYRPDKSQFPRSVIGRHYSGFPDERWLDIRRFQLFERR